MPLPGDQVPVDAQAIMRRIEDLERLVREQGAAKTAESTTIGSGGIQVTGSGGITVIDADGDQTLFIGGRASTPRPDGNPQPVFIVRDDNAHARILLWDPAPNSDGYTQEFWVYDNNGHLAFSTDINGGVAEPWISVPMYRQFNSTAFPESTGTTESLPASACNGAVVWEGRIGKVSHSKIQYDMLFGRLTGTNATPTYSFHVNGVQLESFSVTTFAPQARGPFDISAQLGKTNVIVQVKCSATGTGTDRMAMGMLGCWMRQT